MSDKQNCTLPPDQSCPWEKEPLGSPRCPQWQCSLSWSPSPQTLFTRNNTSTKRSFDIIFFSWNVKIFNYLLNFLSISSHLLTSFTNLRWNTFISGLSCGWERKKREAHIYCLRREIQNLPNLNPPQTKLKKCHWNHPSLSVICRTLHLDRLLCRWFSFSIVESYPLIKTTEVN